MRYRVTRYSHVRRPALGEWARWSRSATRSSRRNWPATTRTARTVDDEVPIIQGRVAGRGAARSPGQDSQAQEVGHGSDQRLHHPRRPAR